MSRDNADGYWSDLVAFHQQEAETARAEVARLRAVIAEAVADCEIALRMSAWMGPRKCIQGIHFQAMETLGILAKATQTGERAGA